MSIDPISLAQALIRCPSIIPKEAGALDALQKALEPLGFHCHRLKFQEPGTEETDNLFARYGTGGPHFCFGGHIDVVDPGNMQAWRFPPFSAEIHDGMLYGRGASDMKGAVAAFSAAAAQFIEKKGGGFTGSISLLIAGDEEGIAINGTKKVLQWLAGRKEIPDDCVVGEPTNPDHIGEMVKIGRRGSITCTLTVTGKQGHVAYPHRADNPITHLIDMLHRLKFHSIDSGTEFFDASNLEITSIDVGNPAVNVIPQHAVAKFNVRFNDMHTGKEIEQWIHRHCAAAGGHYTLETRITGEAFLTKPGKLSEVVKQAVHTVTGSMPTLSTTGGTSDARFIKDYCPVVECGGINATAHMVDECMAVEDIHRLTAVYLEILERYFAG